MVISSWKIIIIIALLIYMHNPFSIFPVIDTAAVYPPKHPTSL